MDDDNIDFDFFDSPGRSEGEENFHDHENKSVKSQQRGSIEESNVNSNAAVSSHYDDDAIVNTNSRDVKSMQSSFLEELVPSAEHSLTSSDESNTSGENDTVDFRVTVTGPRTDGRYSNGSKSDISRNSRTSSPKNVKSKPPLPVVGKSAWRDQSKSDKRPSRRIAIETQPDYDSIANPASLITPGSTFYTSDGRKMRKGRCRYSDKELSESDSSSEEQTTVRRNRRRRPPKDSQLKIGIKDLSPRRSDGSSRSRSRSNSSNWSTGSERNRSGRRTVEELDRPGTRLSRRRSSSSGSSITVSSLSADEEGPEVISHDVTSSLPRRANHTETVDKDRMNLEILLSALLEDDASTAPGEGRRRANANLSPTQKRALKSKSNYTFSNNEAKMIDSENQRLLNNILAQRAAVGQGRSEGRASTASASVPSATSKSSKKSYIHREPPKRVTNATVNRMRDQQRIERENLAMLRRLNKIQPSTDLSRTKNLSDYHRQMSYYCPELRGASDTSSVPSQRSRSSMSIGEGHSGSTQGGRKGRPLSATSNRPSSAYTTTSTRATRPSSATTRRPTSATLRKRPEWQSGW